MGNRHGRLSKRPKTVPTLRGSMAIVVLQKIKKWLADSGHASYSRRVHERRATEDIQGRIRQGRELLKGAARPAVELSPLIDTPVPPEPVSSIGGMPSLPPNEGWPVDPNGRPMRFLAQVRFDQMPALPDFPGTGLMSFFVGAGSLHGLGWRKDTPKAFAVRYFEDTTGLERIAPPKKPSGSDMFGKRLRAEGAPLEGRAVALYPNDPNLEFERVLEELGPSLPGDGDPGGFTAKELEQLVVEALMDEAEANGSAPIYLGGYPRFCQSEIRSPDDSPAMAEVLLQMGYFPDAGRDWQVQWGDSGEASFLAAKEDLLGRRFDRVLYGWECH